MRLSTRTFICHFHGRINNPHNVKVWAPTEMPKMLERREEAVLISLGRGGSSRSAQAYMLHQPGFVWESETSLPYQSALVLEDTLETSFCLFVCFFLSFFLKKKNIYFKQNINKTQNYENMKNTDFISSMPGDI